MMEYDAEVAQEARDMLYYYGASHTIPHCEKEINVCMYDLLQVKKDIKQTKQLLRKIDHLLDIIISVKEQTKGIEV